MSKCKFTTAKRQLYFVEGPSSSSVIVSRILIIPAAEKKNILLVYVAEAQSEHKVLLHGRATESV